MKLIDIVERRSEPRGSYYGVRPTPETIAAMHEFLKTYDIPNPVSLDDAHCTIIYSKLPCSEPPLGDLDPHWQALFAQYNVWPTNPKNGMSTKCLTAGLHSPDMHDRHQHLLMCGAVHSFPEFKPHMTLSYDIGDAYDISQLPPFSGPLVFHHEYHEPLNTDWVNTKAK